MNRALRQVVLLFAIAAVPVAANATTVDFSQLAAPPGGNLQVSTLTDQQIVVDAFSISGSAYTQINTTLFIRTDGANDDGLGVCNPFQQSSSDCANVGTFTGGGGDTNEVDNAIVGELIRLTLPANSTWLSVVISSLDCNGSTNCSSAENGQLWYANTDNLAGTTDLSTFATMVTDYVATSDSTATLSIPLSGNAAGAKYLYFIPTGGTNNDHLIWKASYSQLNIIESTVPAPAGLILVGSGMVAMAVRGRRRRT